jgi:hypothetical protein
LDLIHVEQKAGYLLIAVTGTCDLESARDAARRSIGLFESRKQSKGLVDCRTVSGTLSTVERYDLAVYLAELHARYAVEHGAPLQIACVGSEPLIDPSRFGETVALNRGAQLKVTTDMGEAQAWLTAS